MSSKEHPSWRAGRPAEDPEKTKRWGYVTAKPSEYLVHVRGGQVTAGSGQGATCFKWPWDSVAVVPTSLQKLQFKADQVTAEKVGVEVVGLAVFRIADPRLAFRVLNFSYPERAQEKLVDTLTEMFVGACRRIIASLTVEDCMKRRKVALAAELIAEISPIVAGLGRPEDRTDRGWGVVIDTIEIQEVRVLSEQVFRAMQAPYRAEIERAAKEAEIAASAALEARREAAEERRRQAELEAALKAVAHETARREAEREAAARRLALALEGERAELAAELERRERAAELARAEILAHAGALEWVRVRREVAEAEGELAVLSAAKSAEAARVEGAVRAELARLDADNDRLRAEAEARRKLAENLPRIAAAMGFERIELTQVGTTESPWSQATAAIGHLISLARA